MKFALYITWRILRNVLLFALLPILLPLACVVWLVCITLESWAFSYTRIKRDWEQPK